MENAAPTSSSARPLLDLDRLKPFTDGVFAIVVTILVLELDVPTEHDFASGGGAFLAKMEHQLRPYIASYVLAAVFWVQSTVILRYVRICDRPFAWLNLLFILSVTLLPILTEMRAEYPGIAFTSLLFGSLLVASNLLLLAMWHYVVRRALTHDAPLDPRIIRGMRRRILLGMGACILGAAMAPWSERVSTAIFAAMPLMYLTFGHVDRYSPASS